GYCDDDLNDLHAAADAGLAAYTDAFLEVMVERPHLGPMAPLVLFETLGPALGEGVEGAAVVWGLAQTCFLTYPESVKAAGFADGTPLFDAILGSRAGVTFTVDDYDATWTRVDTPDGRIRLVIPE